MIINPEPTLTEFIDLEPPRAARPTPCAFSFHDAAQVRGDARLNEEWNDCVAASDNLNALFQSPLWWNSLPEAAAGERRKLGVVRSAGGALVGVIPVRTGTYPLSFSAWGTSLGTWNLRAVRVMGCQPFLPDDEGLHLNVMQRLFTEFPECDCVLMEAAESRSFASQFVSRSTALRRLATPYVRQGMTPHYVIEIPATFELYLQKFKSKVRYNLRRQVRRLQEQGAGRLDLIRVETPADVDGFLAEAAMVEAQSWQFQELGATLGASDEYRQRLTRLAEQSALRCYLLRVGGEPSAMVIGYQYAGTYYYSWCGFAQSLAEFSPGTVLLYRIIEDLCSHDRPRRLTFLWGDAGYKRLFATDCLEDTTAVIVSRRARLSARTALALHEAGRRLAARFSRSPAANTTQVVEESE